MPLGFRRAFCALILASAFISPLKSEFSIATFTVPDQLKVRAPQSHLLAFGLSLTPPVDDVKMWMRRNSLRFASSRISQSDSRKLTLNKFNNLTTSFVVFRFSSLFTRAAIIKNDITARRDFVAWTFAPMTLQAEEGETRKVAFTGYFAYCVGWDFLWKNSCFFEITRPLLFCATRDFSSFLLFFLQICAEN